MITGPNFKSIHFKYKTNIKDEKGEPMQYDYEYYDDTKPDSPFVNPHDPSHRQVRQQERYYDSTHRQVRQKNRQKGIMMISSPTLPLSILMILPIDR